MFKSLATPARVRVLGSSLKTRPLISVRASSGIPDLSMTSNETNANSQEQEPSQQLLQQLDSNPISSPQEVKIAADNNLSTKQIKVEAKKNKVDNEINKEKQLQVNSAAVEVLQVSVPRERRPLPRYNLKSLPRVPNTDGISDTVLYNDLLINNFMPLLSPVKKNHMPEKSKNSSSLRNGPLSMKSSKNGASSNRKNKSVLEDLEKFKHFKKTQAEKLKQNSKYYNTYLNKDNLKLPYNSIFCNTALNTQQHNLEMFNLPLNYLEKLKPFKLINKPGDEHYRDDLIIVSKLEFEIEQKLKKAKEAKKNETLDLNEFFGFK